MSTVSESELNGKNMKVEFKMFRGMLTTWESLCRQAAEFASEIGKERLIGMSHSDDHSDGIVTVWYWSE